MATTDGFTLATTSAMLGSTGLMFPDVVADGGVQVGFIGVGGCAGVGAGVGLGAGPGVIVISGMAQPALSTSIETAMISVSTKLIILQRITIIIVTQSLKQGQ
jgi:hypothetical protein